MKHTPHSLLIVLLASYLWCSGCASLGWFEEENPRAVTELIEIKDEKVSVQEVWQNSIGDLEEVYNKIHPYITGSRVYLSNAEGVVEAWQRADGERLWSVKLEQKISGGVNGDYGMIAVGTENGEVIALNSKNGMQRWRARVPSEVMALSAAKYGVIVVRTNDSKVHALDLDSGSTIWSAGKGAPPLTLRGASRPKVMDDVVLVGLDDGKLMAIDLRSGELIWEVAVSIPQGRSELERMSDVDGEFSYFNGTVFAVSFNGRVVAIDSGTGKILWSKDLSSYTGLGADQDRVYVADVDDNIWCLEASTGTTLWRQDELLFRGITAPQVMGDYVLTCDAAGYCHWLSKVSGKIVGREEVAREAIEATPAVIDDRVYVLANNGTLSVLQYKE